jgi:hypothetical protein
LACWLYRRFLPPGLGALGVGLGLLAAYTEPGKGGEADEACAHRRHAVWRAR